MAIFFDFGIMSLLLVVGQILRSRVKLLQMFFIPTPIIAGFLGLLVVNTAPLFEIYPFSLENESALESDSPKWAMATYPGILVVLLFATLFMGYQERQDTSVIQEIKKVANTFFYNMASYPGMYGMALLFGILVLAPLFPDLNPSFSLMLPVGFVGGHGTASAVGSFLQENGWENALDIGNTFATVGMLVAIFGGMILINVGTRKGWTRLVKSAEEIPDSIKKGFLDESERKPLGQETVSAMAMDPLAWHVALVFVAFALSYLTRDLIRFCFPGNYPIPIFALSMLIGAGLQLGLNAIKVGQYVNIDVIGRIGSTVSDFLIAFAITSIKLQVVLDLWMPLTIMSVFGLLYSFGVFWFIGRRIFHNFWFSRSIFVYGWNTGVVAIGITLLRVVDPQLKSRTLQEYGLAYIFISIVEIGFLIILPPLIINHVILIPALVLLGLFAACILISRHFVGWFKQPPHELREGEAEMIVAKDENDRYTEQEMTTSES